MASGYQPKSELDNWDDNGLFHVPAHTAGHYPNSGGYWTSSVSKTASFDVSEEMAEEYANEIGGK